MNKVIARQCSGRNSNPRHVDRESSALTTTLHHRATNCSQLFPITSSVTFSSTVSLYPSSRQSPFEQCSQWGSGESWCSSCPNHFFCLVLNVSRSSLLTPTVCNTSLFVLCSVHDILSVSEGAEYCGINWSVFIAPCRSMSSCYGALFMTTGVICWLHLLSVYGSVKAL